MRCASVSQVNLSVGGCQVTGIALSVCYRGDQTSGASRRDQHSAGGAASLRPHRKLEVPRPSGLWNQPAQ